MTSHFVMAIAVLAMSPDAYAQSVGGKYTVSGTNIDGSRYSGAAQITPSGSGCRISWNTGSTGSSGTCMLANKSLAAAYQLGEDHGMAVYELQPNGSLRGWWTIVGKQGVGTETLTPSQ